MPHNVVAVWNCGTVRIISILFLRPITCLVIENLDIDTDEVEGRGGELEEETVEFFIKEETTFIDE